MNLKPFLKVLETAQEALAKSGYTADQYANTQKIVNDAVSKITQELSTATVADAKDLTAAKEDVTKVAVAAMTVAKKSTDVAFKQRMVIFAASATQSGANIDAKRNEISKMIVSKEDKRSSSFGDVSVAKKTATLVNKGYGPSKNTEEQKKLLDKENILNYQPMGIRAGGGH